jgi:murein DD-endopeptidase MepM/ murein hydrolase activator NlpD
LSNLSDKKSAWLGDFIQKAKDIACGTLFNGANNRNSKGVFQNPLFYFGLFSFILMGSLFFGSNSLAKLSYFSNNDALFFSPLFKNNEVAGDNNLFFGQSKGLTLETPDLKIIGDNSVYGISTPRLLTTQTLGNIFGGINQDRKDIIDYIVQPGDSLDKIAEEFNISWQTITWTNNISKNSPLKAGQNLVILPVSGVIHFVKSGDTISEISKTYKSNEESIIAFNNLDGRIYIGDILIIPDGIMPSKPIPSISQTQLANSFFIYPAEGVISQGLHYYNAVDIANKFGTPIRAAAAGVVQGVRYGWNLGGGNNITILHENNVVTYYGHLSSMSVRSGDAVYAGQIIGFMGITGITTGSHLHFQVVGAKNPFNFPKGTQIKY